MAFFREFLRKRKVRTEKLASIPSEGHCQMCGKAGSAREVSKYGVSFFCSED